MSEIQLEKQQAELEFWKEWMAKPDYVQIRRQDWIDKTRWFDIYPWQVLPDPQRALDLGCGPDSVFENTPYAGHVTACDRLMELYPKSPLRERCLYKEEDAENLSFASGEFDWVFCVNMIDHTPDPVKVISEIHRVLRPEGLLFFEVHFDPHLFAPHYSLWNETVVQVAFWKPVITRDGRPGYWKLLRKVMNWEPQWGKYTYWATFMKIG
jgi:SAM-dependent methyltransferase